MTERTRFTISCDVDTYEAFADLAESSGVSLSRCIGDWLRDTAEAAQMTTIRINEVRKSPEEAFRAYQVQVARSLPDLAAKYERTRWGKASSVASIAARGHGEAVEPAGRPLRRDGGSSAAGGRTAVPAQPAPPSSNTGGKSPGRTRRQA